MEGQRDDKNCHQNRFLTVLVDSLTFHSANRATTWIYGGDRGKLEVHKIVDRSIHGKRNYERKGLEYFTKFTSLTGFTTFPVTYSYLHTSAKEYEMAKLVRYFLCEAQQCEEKCTSSHFEFFCVREESVVHCKTVRGTPVSLTSCEEAIFRSSFAIFAESIIWNKWEKKA